MVKWKIYFFPPPSEKHSPYDALLHIDQTEDKALIKQRLEVISQLDPWNWPHWVKLVNKIYQLTANDYRVYFDFIDSNIIVCHICRKVSQKALSGDLARARKNLDEYKESLK